VKPAGLAAIASAIAFAAAVYLRMNAAYGPLHLSLRPGDWLILWELWQLGQIAPRIVAESIALGLVAAALPWGVLRALRHRAR
jgi:hypothetical protein